MAEVASNESKTELVAFTASLPDGGTITITPGEHAQDHLSDLLPEQRERVINLIQELMAGKFDTAVGMLFMIICTLSHAEELGELDGALDLLEEPIITEEPSWHRSGSPNNYLGSTRSLYGRESNSSFDVLFGDPFADDLVATSPLGEHSISLIDSDILLALTGITPELLADAFGIRDIPLDLAEDDNYAADRVDDLSEEDDTRS